MTAACGSSYCFAAVAVSAAEIVADATMAADANSFTAIEHSNLKSPKNPRYSFLCRGSFMALPDSHGSGCSSLSVPSYLYSRSDVS